MPVSSTSEKSLLPTESLYGTKEIRQRRFRQLKHFSNIGDANGRTNDCDSEFFSSNDYDGCTDTVDVFASYSSNGVNGDGACGNGIGIGGGVGGGGGKILRISRIRRKRREHMRYQHYGIINMETNAANTSSNKDIPNTNNRIRNVLDRVQYEISKLRSEFRSIRILKFVWSFRNINQFCSSFICSYAK